MGVSRELREKLGRITPRKYPRRERSESLLQMQLLFALIYVEYGETLKSKNPYLLLFFFLKSVRVFPVIS